MAEKYGTIPKRFTSEWWEYFWMYYKVHTIVVILVLFAIVFTVYQVCTQPKYDLNIAYVSSLLFDETIENELREDVIGKIEDIDENGEKSIYFEHLIFSEDSTESEYTSAVITKLNLGYITDDILLYVFSEEKGKYLFGDDSLDGLFGSASDWLNDGVEIDDDKLYKVGDKAYGVKISSTVLADMPGNDLYVAVRNLRPGADENAVKRFAESKKIANYLIKQ